MSRVTFTYFHLFTCNRYENDILLVKSEYNFLYLKLYIYTYMYIYMYIIDR